MWITLRDVISCDEISIWFQYYIHNTHCTPRYIEKSSVIGAKSDFTFLIFVDFP